MSKAFRRGKKPLPSWIHQPVSNGNMLWSVPFAFKALFLSHFLTSKVSSNQGMNPSKVSKQRIYFTYLR